ncbi:MAG: hypothetical protein ACI9K2_005353 [Myxococcota bacterium]
MTRSAVIAVLVALGCGRSPPATTGELLDRETAEASRVESVVGPTIWFRGGLMLAVPDGWIGTTSEETPLDITHRASGVRFVILQEPLEAAGPLATRHGYHRVFTDQAAYRAVPLLTPAGTATWRGDDNERVLLAFWGVVDARLVRVELHAPPGRVLVALAVCEPLVYGLRRSEPLAQDAIDVGDPG